MPGMGIPPEVLLLLKMFSHVKFRIVISMSVKNCVGVLMRITLHLLVAVGRMAISIMLILSINENRRSFHLLSSSSISSFRD